MIGDRSAWDIRHTLPGRGLVALSALCAVVAEGLVTLLEGAREALLSDRGYEVREGPRV